MNSKNITATEGRANNLLKQLTSNAINTTVPQQITEKVNSERIRTGVISKFYPYIDKAEVVLDYNNKTVLCKILHRYGGDIMDFFTPLAIEKGFDTSIHEPYIVPQAEQNVCVLNIHDADSEENLILGYYQNEEIVEYNPASPGNVKLMCLSEDNQYWVKFGRDGFDYRGSASPTMTVGTVMDDMEDVVNVNTTEVYLKDEVDELISALSERITVLEELLDDDNGD